MADNFDDHSFEAIPQGYNLAGIITSLNFNNDFTQVDVPDVISQLATLTDNQLTQLAPYLSQDDRQEILGIAINAYLNDEKSVEDISTIVLGIKEDYTDTLFNRVQNELANPNGLYTDREINTLTIDELKALLPQLEHSTIMALHQDIADDYTDARPDYMVEILSDKTDYRETIPTNTEPTLEEKLQAVDIDIGADGKVFEYADNIDDLLE